MKAGNAGSIPDGVAKPDWSFALKVLLQEIGDAVASLNAVVVGLDAVERGHEKPESLNISWNPTDRTAAARKARKFVLESVLVHVSEAVNQYILALSKLPRFATIRGEWSKNDADDSVAGKLTSLAIDVVGKDDFLVPASVLLVHWRNRIVHKNSKAKLDRELKLLLHKNEEVIAEKYSDLNVDCLLCHFESARPSLKDVTSLVAMTINLAKKMDSKILDRFELADLQAWLDHYKITIAIEKVQAETKPEKLDKSIQRIFTTCAPELWKPYHSFFIDDSFQ